MKDKKTSHLSFDEYDELRSPRPTVQGFDRVVDSAISRRGFLSVIAMGSGAAALGGGALAVAFSRNAEAATDTWTGNRFNFEPIPTYTDYDVHVPEGYNWQVLIAWGEPMMGDTPGFDAGTGGTAETQARSFGENTDGMELFTIDGSEVICINHEYVNPEINLPEVRAAAIAALEDAAALDSSVDVEGDLLVLPTSAQDVLKLQNAQGISVMEVVEQDWGWTVFKESRFSRRITQNTPMRIAGPAAGHALMSTDADPEGVEVLGTMNNCGSGRTPWGTYLTCEENFNGYFGSTDDSVELPEAFSRYGIGTFSRYLYEQFDERFDLSKNINEPNRFGWIVEIDPSDATSKPVKRTALGRFKHENAACVLAPDGRVVVYMGDDERGEYLYKYVSTHAYVAGGETEHLLNDGQLYAARFNDDMSGEWVALTPESTGMDAAEILIHTRMAASAVDATTMDRPEWVAVNPIAVQAYCALTNNSSRGISPNGGGDETPVGGPNPREANNYGQIVRWYPSNADHADTGFSWDLYVMAGNPLVHSDAYAGSENINAGNLFNSPDGMVFDSNGLLWIQTDGSDSNAGDYEGMGNNQMLVGDPATGEIARFLTGPKGSEVTGITWSADRRTAFVGIQHPGGTWPHGIDNMPRSAVIAIKRQDNGILG